MPVKNTTRIECDYAEDGKKCGAVFAISNPPDGEVPGLENVVSVSVMGREYYFCSMIHLIAFAMAWIKNTSEDAKKAPAAAAASAIAPMDDLSLS